MAFDRGLRIVSWNTRALISISGQRRRRKLKLLRILMHKYDVLLLQETHNTQDVVEAWCRKYAPQFHAFVSTHAAPDTGGLVTLVRKSAGLNPQHTTHNVVPGRVLGLSITIGPHLRDPSPAPDTHLTHRLSIWNIHNHDLPPDALPRLRPLLSLDLDLAAAAPNDNTVIIGGDFNFLPAGAMRVKIDTPQNATQLSELPPSMAQERARNAWEPIFSMEQT